MKQNAPSSRGSFGAIVPTLDVLTGPHAVQASGVPLVQVAPVGTAPAQRLSLTDAGAPADVPLAVREILFFPARLVPGLYVWTLDCVLDTSRTVRADTRPALLGAGMDGSAAPTLEGMDAIPVQMPRVLFTGSRREYAAARAAGMCVFLGSEWAALTLGAEYDRAQPDALAGWVTRKVTETAWKITDEVAMGARLAPDAQRERLCVGDVLGRWGLKLRDVRMHEQELAEAWAARAAQASQAGTHAQTGVGGQRSGGVAAGR